MSRHIAVVGTLTPRPRERRRGRKRGEGSITKLRDLLSLPKARSRRVLHRNDFGACPSAFDTTARC